MFADLFLILCGAGGGSCATKTVAGSTSTCCSLTDWDLGHLFRLMILIDFPPHHSLTPTLSNICDNISINNEATWRSRITAMILSSLLLPLVLSPPVTSGAKVVLLVTEGLTESLLSRVPTPAIDALISQGTLASLKPEFPAETLPTLAALVTGQHTEMTGVLDRDVQDQDGNILHSASDPEFWQYDQNLTTIMVSSHLIDLHRER